jgi:hypothetical protein
MRSLRKSLTVATLDAVAVSSVIGWVMAIMAMQDLRTAGDVFAPMVAPMTHLQATGLLWGSFVVAIGSIYWTVKIRWTSRLDKA